jgi:hypothetical protein
MERVAADQDKARMRHQAKHARGDAQKTILSFPGTQAADHSYERRVRGDGVAKAKLSSVQGGIKARQVKPVVHDLDAILAWKMTRCGARVRNYAR